MNTQNKLDDDQILDLELPDIEHTTIRDYFKALLMQLIVDGDGFSAKRPLGNSDWQWELYETLARAKLIDADWDPGEPDHSYMIDCDTRAGDKLLCRLVESL